LVISRVLKLAGALTVLLLASFITLSLLRERRAGFPSTGTPGEGGEGA